MVDRIAPATSDRERAITRDEFGIEDAWPVFCEDFLQWVVEDEFPAGRPAFEEVGAEFVADVTPFEMMKIRILNGGHAIIAYPVGPHGHPLRPRGHGRTRWSAPSCSKVEREEIIPDRARRSPNTDLDDYFRKVEERCLNPKIGDTIRRLCLDGSNRQPKFIIPSIADRLASGLPVDGLALESALWARYCAGTTDSGAVIEPNDPNWDRLTAQADAAREDPAAWLAMRDIYGATADAPGLPRRLRRLAPRPLVRRHRGDAPPLPRMIAPVRDARPEEAAEIAALLRASIADLCAADHRNDAAVVAAWTANKTPETVAAWIADPSQRLLVASCDGRLAGVAAARRSGELLLLYVAPGAAGRGCGTALLAAAEAWLRAVGAPAVRLESTVTARDFYRARGYAEVGAPVRRRGAGGFPMLKRLDPPATALVIFDCDGVLVDSEPIALRLLVETLAAAGLHARRRPRPTRSSSAARSPRPARSSPATTASPSPTPPSTPCAAALYAAFRAELAPIPGIAATLDALPCPYCVASSSQPERIALSLAVTGLWPRFEGRAFSATMVARGKPAPDLFLFAAETLGYAPAACLVVEDSPAGITGGEGRRHAGGGLHRGKPCRRDEHRAAIAAPRPRRDHRRHARSSRRWSGAEPGRPAPAGRGLATAGQGALPLLAFGQFTARGYLRTEDGGGCAGTLRVGPDARDLDARRRRRHRHRQRPRRHLRPRRPPPRPRRGADRDPRAGPRATPSSTPPQIWQAACAALRAARAEAAAAPAQRSPASPSTPPARSSSATPPAARSPPRPPATTAATPSSGSTTAPSPRPRRCTATGPTRCSTSPAAPCRPRCSSRSSSG